MRAADMGGIWDWSSVFWLLVSLTFNLLQLKWRNEGRAERAKEKTDQERKDQDKEAEQRSREQAPTEFYNFGGTPGPILVSGNQHSQGFMDFTRALPCSKTRRCIGISFRPIRKASIIAVLAVVESAVETRYLGQL